MLYPTVKNTLTGRIAFPALDALREGYDVYPVVDAIAGTSVEAHRAGLERRTVLVGLSALVLASDVIGGIVYDATGPGGALIVAALGALTLLGRAGAAISSPPAGFGDLARKARSVEQERAHHEHAGVAVRGHTEAATRKERNCYAQRGCDDWIRTA